ncbi:unnamed protein product [Bursaphelenchus okinawaensis]|uniref:FAD dependent oxidoreductase domain-containing protein n=1 Tax=Bursaphelenchus okinawaensis TaxID=465554 RepID=A0A811KYI9_9BILA|nr:unnamed protein product [Bursaphelenchus okinawaensis]CAG9113934.1 unnamed protein product [Bursaphelenchus okinawaensis]
MTKIAIVGEGIVGCSTALALLEKYPKLNVTLFSNAPFEESCSFGPGGLFRLDKYEARTWAKKSFERFAYLEKNFGHECGVKLISGHIQSDNLDLLKSQEKNMADMVYNFRWLDDRERNLLFVNPSKYCIHYTAYASEGRTYTPWIKKHLQKRGAQFATREFRNLDEVANLGFEYVINSAGVYGGKLAGDDLEGIKPNRGVAFEVDAPWQKHFNYRDFSTFTIPMVNGVMMGTVREADCWERKITDQDRKEILERYIELDPKFKGVKILSEWVSLRPERKEIRVEYQKRNSNGKEYHVVHNYGHGGNGFTLGWGCAQDVVNLLEPHFKN